MWTQPLKNRHTQNSFSKKTGHNLRKGTLSNHNLGHKYSNLWLYLRLCMPFWRLLLLGTTSKMLCPQPRSQQFCNRRAHSNSCLLGFKFQVEFGYAFGDEKKEYRFVRIPCLEHLQTGIHAFCHSHCHSMPFPHFASNHLAIGGKFTVEDIMIIVSKKVPSTLRYSSTRVRQYQVIE